ncbi:MAG: hypothetical protein Q8M94_14740 [Ignavibacteria bacterium]|nr:hypothetical protein [Ignavibacteria bacterium]
MIRFLAIILFASLLFISCEKKSAVTPKVVVENKVLSVEDLGNENFIYKSGNVTVQGLCIHVCAHSGKKMFIVGKSPNDKFQIYTSDKIPAFDKKLEGSNIIVTGTLEEERIDMAYVAEMESDIDKGKTSASCVTEDEMKEINDLKAKISKSKKGFISIYTMICSEVKAI